MTRIENGEIEEFVGCRVRESGFSGVVMIRSRGEIVFAQASGMANRSEGIPNALQTRFAIASGTKTFTALAVCQLVDQKRLRLDARLGECLPYSFPRFAEEITVEQLLTHRSGVPDYADEERGDDYAAIWNERPTYSMRSPADFLPLFQNLPMKSVPGARFGYSNSGYILLGLIVEQVTGGSYFAYVEEEVLAAAGMKDTGFFELDRLPPRTARGYIPVDEPGGWKTNVFSVPVKGGPDGGLFATGGDLLRFHDALWGNRLLSPRSTAAFAEPRVQAGDDPHTRYGYGLWFRTGNGEVIRRTMTGGDPGAEFVFDSYPGLDLQVVLLSNSEGGLSGICRALRERFDPPV